MIRLAIRNTKSFRSAAVLLVVLVAAGAGVAQKRSKPAKQSKPPAPVTEVSKLRDDYLKTTREYKASLQTLVTLYENSVKKAEQRADQTKTLFAAGLVSKTELENSEQALSDAQAKVSGVRQQIATADVEIAQGLVEIEGDKHIAKVSRGSLVRTTSMIRYGGAGAWVLSQAGKIQNFFLQKFGRPLPVAVFGQGAIHDQWHLDHRNAMDVSVYPDTVEGQGLMEFLRANGIPFSAFRTAIPGVATGPHIHIGLPSHRY